jgi:hypothetical protein
MHSVHAAAASPPLGAWNNSLVARTIKETMLINAMLSGKRPADEGLVVGVVVVGWWSAEAVARPSPDSISP